MSAALTAPGASDTEVPLSERGPAPRSVLVAYGFWLFLLSDIILFASLFAAYAVLSHRTAGGPAGAALFDRRHVLVETACLLASSGTCGVMSMMVELQRRGAAYLAGASTLVLGAAFVALECREFADLLAAGHGPQRSAFLSSFYALVGAHGVHVTLGLVWLVVMMLQVATLGWRPMVIGRLRCFALYWHALDIVWIGVFTIVYLGAR